MTDESDKTGAYLDYAASNPLWPEAASAMVAAAGTAGNPSAVHAAGRRAREILDGARRSVAAAFGADPAGVTFVSGATEANNLAVFGLVRAALREFPGRRLEAALSVLEHPSVSRPVGEMVRSSGGRLAVRDLPLLSGQAVIDAQAAFRTVGPDTVLVCLTAANNILGTVQPVRELAAAVRAERRRRAEFGDRLPIRLLCDAVQAAAWLDCRLETLEADLISVSGHKVGGPKGVGALIAGPGVGSDAIPLLYGGGQEGGRRSGTENLPGIAGMAAALAHAVSFREAETKRCLGLRQRLLDGLQAIDSRIAVLGNGGECVPGTVFLHWPGMKGDLLAVMLDAAGFSVSSGSACDSGRRQPPELLKAAFGEAVFRWGGVRVSFGRLTEPEEIDGLLRSLSACRSR